jgi:membrane-associated phospholipid phosphatase
MPGNRHKLFKLIDFIKIKIPEYALNSKRQLISNIWPFVLNHLILTGHFHSCVPYKSRLRNKLMKSVIRFTLSFILIFHINNCSAQNPDTLKTNFNRKEYSLKSIGKDLLHDEGKIWSKPFCLKKKDFQILIPAIVGTGLIIAYDKPLFENVQTLTKNNPGLIDAGSFITHGGEATGTLGIAGLLLAGGLIFNDPKAKETGILAAEAFLHTGLVVYVTKLIFGRERPLSESMNGDFTFMSKALINSDHNSFPSGHSTSAWAVATVIATEYRSTMWVPVLAYASAASVSASRVVLHKHWPADVAAGGLLGYAIGRLVVAEHHKRWSVLPTATLNKNIGINFSAQF